MAPANVVALVARRPLAAGALLLTLGVAAAPEAPWLGLIVPLLAWRWLRSISLFFGLGVALVLLRGAPPSEVAVWTRGLEGPVVLDGVISSAPELRPEAELFTLDLVAIMPRPPGPVMATRGRVRVWLPRSHPGGRPTEACGWPGDRVRVLAQLSSLAPALHEGAALVGESQARRGLSGLARARDHRHCRRVQPAPAPDFGHRVERVRAAVHEVIERHRHDAAGAVVRAFATGDRSGIPRELEQAFADSGLSHLLAISGMNLAIVASLFLVGLASVLRHLPVVSLGPGVPRVTALAALPLLILYTHLVGLSASAVRAAFMSSLLLVACWLRRRLDAMSALGLAVIAMLCLDPLTLYDASFQLSIAAVVALFDLYPRLKARLVPALDGRPLWWRAPVEVALVSLAATIGTAPIVAAYFQRLSLVGVWVNVPAAPLGSLVLVPLSLVGGLLSSVSERWAAPVLKAASLAAELLISLAESARGLPLATVPLPAPSLFELGFAYLLIYLRPGRGPRPRVLWALGALALAASWSSPLWTRPFRAELEVTFLPVGQGDATLIELPGGAVWLVDVGPPARDGPSPAERVIVAALRSRGIRAIDTLVLTHPHADHVGGLPAITEAFEVRRILWNGDRRESSSALLAPIEGRAEVVPCDAPLVAEHGASRVRVFAPFEDCRELASVNDRSLLVSVELGERRILLTGDAEEAAEAHLLERRRGGLRADVLKAGHHGSRGASTPEFLDAVEPEHVVLSLGRNNRFGFPHAEVLERLRARGVQTWRTDLHGLVRVRTDGTDLEVEPYRRPLEASRRTTSLGP